MATEPILIGGTEVDAEVMRFVRLRELADAQLAKGDVRAFCDVQVISEQISLALSAALTREDGNHNDE